VREAFKRGLIDDVDVWMDMIGKRGADHRASAAAPGGAST
jgi:hypothetical protein